MDKRASVTVFAGDKHHFYAYLPVTWVVGGRTLTFNQLVDGLIELALALLIVWWVRRRWQPS